MYSHLHRVIKLGLLTITIPQTIEDKADGDVCHLDLKARSLTTIAEILRIHDSANGDAESRGTDLKRADAARLVHCLTKLFARDVGEKVAFAVILDNNWNVFDTSAAVPTVSDKSLNLNDGNAEAYVNTLASGL